jgi:hypothetical protein
MKRRPMAFGNGWPRLNQQSQFWRGLHPGEVSPATGTAGVLAATAKLLIIIHGHANPDEEELVSWDASKDACVADLARLLSEPHNPGGGKS